MIANCRICLGENAVQNIYSLPKAIGVEKSPKDVILFCLGIKITHAPNITTKLCSKCHSLVQKYYRFKQLAQKSNSYLHSLNLNNDGNTVPKVETENKQDEQQAQEPEIFDADWDDDKTIKSEPDVLNDNLFENLVDNMTVDNLVENMTVDNLVENMTVELNPEMVDDWDEDMKLELTSVHEEQACEPVNQEPLQIEATKKAVKKNAKDPTKVLVKSVCCQLCNKKFSSKSRMHFHQRKYHLSYIERFQCDYCDISFFRKPDLQQHIDKLHLEWKCDQCRALLKSRLNYEKHCKTHDVDYKPKANTAETEKNKKVCPVCGKLIAHLFNHMRTHKGIKYPCKECDKKFRSRGAWERHYKSKHQGVVYRCTLCNIDTKDMTQHRKRYHSPNALQYKCPMCPYTGVCASGLANHVSSHREPDIPCPKCHKLFKNETRLKMHCRQVHEGEVRHNCLECSKGFFYKSDLTIHMACHTSEKPFECDQCYEPFKLRRNLIKHMKTKHNMNA